MGKIQCTHTGSLPRPTVLQNLLYAMERGEPFDQAAFEQAAAAAVSAVVQQQVSCGLDVVNDGEQGKISYATYVKSRLSGFQGTSRSPTFPGLAEAGQFPEFFSGPLMEATAAFGVLQFPSCNGPITYTGALPLQRDITNLQAALRAAGRAPSSAFITAASPGTIASWLHNSYFDTYEEYIFSIAEAMKQEYEAIARAGFLLQVDCPDLPKPTVYQSLQVGDAELRALHLEALNHALEGIPPERLRMHVCFGNYEAPHTSDPPLREFIYPLLQQARPATLVLESSNPRHGHEWEVWEEVKLPSGKQLVIGVVDTTTNFVEHPRLVAQRIVSVARLVGPENVQAGTDCGFATFAGMHPVEPRIAWAKLAAMVEGARLASQQLRLG